jgi:hypothetical protein
MKKQISLEINGMPYDVVVSHRDLLVDVLRKKIKNPPTLAFRPKALVGRFIYGGLVCKIQLVKFQNHYN